MTDLPPPWSDGAAYERYAGRWSRPVAAELVAWLGVAPGGRWLDVGCGTGALAATILAVAEPAALLGVDPSPAFVAEAARRAADRRAEFRVAAAEALPVAGGAYDAVVSGLVLNFVADRPAALAEMRRAARAGGVVSAYVWDYGDGMQPMRAFWDAATALDPAAAPLDEGGRFAALASADALGSLLRSSGLREVTTRSIEVPTEFRDFEDYWAPFLGGVGPAPAYAMSLDEERRARLRERLRAGLPTEAGGAIRLTARAWAARGLV